MSYFWRYRVRRSLLTALLRCGIKFNNDSGKTFCNCLLSCDYLRLTKKAVERFLAGNIYVKIKRHQEFTGWYDFFSKKNNPEKHLVKTKKKKYKNANII